MKLHTENRSLESAGMNISVDFSVKMNGKAFNVLSSGVYSDAISSIVRELSSNCCDSHIAARKADVPFEVYCPTGFDPYFAVKDFGTGLRYFKYHGRVKCEIDGESTICISGDIRNTIANIRVVILNGNTTVGITTILYDNTADETIFRIPLTLKNNSTIDVEFDDALVLYSTYFESTKEDSNDFIGAFGLGSKTPFAYTDNFIVINRYNGIARTYNIFTSENGVPQINLMGMSNTDECNGLEVKLSIANDDHIKFKNAIKEQLKFFDPLPKIYNDTINFPTILHKGENFILMDDTEVSVDNMYYRGYNVVIGNNAYNIPYNVVSLSKIFKHKLVLRLDIGEVMVTASREAIKTDEVTRDIIIERFNRATEEYTNYILDMISRDDMLDYEKAIFLNNNSDSIDLDLDSVHKNVGNPHYLYNSNEISIPVSLWGSYISFDYTEKETTDFYGNIKTAFTVNHARAKYVSSVWYEYDLNKNKSKRIGLGQKEWVNFSPQSTYLVFIRDDAYAFHKKITQYFDTNNTSKCNKILIVDSFIEDVNIEAINELVSFNTTFVKLSDIKLPKTARIACSNKSTTPIARIFTIGKDSGYIFSRLTDWGTVYTSLKKIENENAYVVSSYRDKFDNIQYNDIMFFQTSITLGLIDKRIEIYAVPKAKYEKAVKYGFKPITDLINELKTKFHIPVDYVNYLALKILIDDINKTHDIFKLFKHFNDSDWNKINTNTNLYILHRIVEIFEKRYLKKGSIFNDIKKLSNYMDTGCIPEQSEFVKKTIDKVAELCYDVTSSMLLLNNINHYSFGDNDEERDALIKYVNFIG